MSTDHLIKTLERAAHELYLLECEQNGLHPQQRGAVQGRINAMRDNVRAARLMAFRAIRQGDIDSFIRVLGVNHAYDACRILGIGSLQALLSCTRNQFKLLARPNTLGWGPADAIPAQVDRRIVEDVEAALRGIGKEFRDPNVKPMVKLPEPVLSATFDRGFNVKHRFDPMCRDFSDYAHPAVVQASPGRPSILNALAQRGIYCWDDLTQRTEQDLVRSGLDKAQAKTVQYEMRRRGLLFMKEDAPQEVSLESIETDKYHAKNIRAVVDVSQEDEIKVRDKNNVVVATLEVDNEFRDRVKSDIDDERLLTPREDMFGVVDTYEENADDDEEEAQK